jgi:branched-chain amino acid transport system substrate-binding protein
MEFPLRIQSTLLISTLLILMLLVSGCGGKEADESVSACSVINIGVITSLTNNNASGGTELLRGIEMASDDLNAQGGILGCPLELIVIDDASSNDMAQLAVKELVEDYQVPAIIGSFSSNATTAAAGVANVYNIPLLVPSASSDLITDLGYDWVFRVNAPASSYARSALGFASTIGNSMPIETSAIIFSNTFFGESAAAVLVTQSRELDIEIVAYEPFSEGAANYKALLNRVSLEEPDVIIIATNSLTSARILLDEIKTRAEIKPAMIVGLAGAFANPEFLTLGETAEKVFVTVQWSGDVSWVDKTGQDAPAFIQRFTERYGVPPGSRSLQAYITTYVLANAIENAGQEDKLDFSDPESMRQSIRGALKITNMEQTLFGNIQFDENGQNNHPALIVQVIDGQYVTVFPKEVQAREAIIGP